ASCLNYAVVDGRAHQYLWPNHGALVVYVWRLALSLVSIFLLLLATSFLNTRQFAPKIHAVMLAFLFANIGSAMALIWADPLIILEIQFYLLIPTLIAVVAASIAVLYTGYTPARYFTVAQTVPLLIGIIPVVAALNSHPYTPIFRELSVPGNILMVMFTSFALADRIGFLQQENRSTWQALTESERRLVQYLEAIPVGIAVYGANRELTYVNQTALELADQPQGRRTNNIEDALASYRFYVSDTDLTYPLDQLPLTQALQGHVSSVDDVEIATPTRRYPAAMWATPVKNPEGQVEYAVCAFQDISTIRAAERVAREAQALYRRVVEDQPSFICRFLPDGRLSFANLAFTSFVESGTANVVNASMFDMMEAEDAMEFRQSLDALNLTNQVSTNETRMRNGRGKLAWVQWTTRVLLDAYDKPSEYQALGLDVTKAKLAEFELAKYRNQLEDLVVTRTTALSQANADLKRRAEELATLNVITRTLAATTELDVVLSEILVQLARVTAFECAQIYLRDGPWLTIAESVGPEAGVSPRQVAVTDVENAIVQVFTEQRTIVRTRPDSAPGNDVTADDQRDNVVVVYAHAEQENPAAWVGAPLLVGNESIGVLAVTAARTDTYGADDVRNLSAFADQAAVAVLNARLNQQAQVAAASRERERLARELHDAVTQTLFSATIMAEALPQQWQVDTPGALVTLEKLRHMTRGALAEMRTLLWELRPGEVETVPFGTLLQHLGDALTGNTMVPVFVNCSPPDLLLPPEVQIALYRVAQEALNNIAKHANATGVEVTARAETDGCTLCIRDDGCGFDTAGTVPGHLGLTIMYERVQAIGGRLKISSVPGQGTEVLVQWSSSSGAG
ncbi:MAG: PAS domain S-box protein, partial [Planctomycetales bacterium]|nr:PAS domain S-box protein [Planctomycetales bacterium]